MKGQSATRYTGIKYGLSQHRIIQGQSVAKDVVAESRMQQNYKEKVKVSLGT
jgi:hypothetical protein